MKHTKLKWRAEHSVKRNADLCPTHGVGPAAHCLNIDRGNRFVHLTSAMIVIEIGHEKLPVI
jgi:Glycosyl hydrolase 109, C-terminal domain